MLVRLTVSNYKSFRNEQTFTMQAKTSLRSLPGAVLRTPTADLLKVAAIYGHNASGKTNLLDVLMALDVIVVSGGRDAIPQRGVQKVDPFRLDPILRDQPSRFEIELLLGPHRYVYALWATTERIVREKLTYRDDGGGSGRWRRLFERNQEGGTRFGRAFGSSARHQQLEEATVPERSMLGHAAALNIKHARRIFDWFERQLHFYDLHRAPEKQFELLADLADRLREDDVFRERYLRLIRDADVGVVDAVAEPRTAEQLELFSKFYAVLSGAMQAGGVEVPDTPPRSMFNDVRLIHRDEDSGRTEVFPFSCESSGTRRFMALTYAVLRHDGGDAPVTLVVDELDASLSSELVQRLVLLAQDATTNPAGMQIIFTTHDRSLLDDPHLLRRDQMWVTQKRPGGGTDLYSLADFPSGEIRPNRPLGRQFATGRFGGVAEFGPSLDMLRVRDEAQTLPLFERWAETVGAAEKREAEHG